MPKSISCPHAGCGYLFSKPVHLRRHLLSHSDEAVWKCPNCDQDFKRIDSFQRHKKRIHPDQPNLIALKIAADRAADSSIESEDDDDVDDRRDGLHLSSNAAIPQQALRPSASSCGGASSSPASSRPAASSPNSACHRPQHYHPYLRNHAGSQPTTSAQQQQQQQPQPQPPASDTSNIAQGPWQTQNGPSQLYDNNNTANYANLYSAPISYNDYGSLVSSGLAPSGPGYGQQASDLVAPLSIASLTQASPSWWSSSNSDTEAHNFFDDILQSILMDSISSFVPHETIALPSDFQQSMATSNMANEVFAFAQQNSHPAPYNQPIQSQQQNQHMQPIQQQQQSVSQPASAFPNQQQQSSQPQDTQPQDTQSPPASSSSHPVPQPLANLMPFATLTESAHNSGRSTPATPRHPPTNGNTEDTDEMTRLVEKVGDQAATSVGARTRDLILHGVNIPKKPPRLTAASLFSAATRHTRSMLPLLPSYWLLNYRRLAAERPYVFISLLAIGTLWQPGADVKAYGAELWQLIFRSIWAGAVFYLDQPQLMREATAVMAFTHLYAFLCRDEGIRRKSIHSTYTGSSLAREYGWRQGIWFLVGPWEESLQRLLGPNLQMALVELQILTRDQNANKLSADQKSLLDRLHALWKQWSDAEEVNRNMILHSVTESHHSEFLSSYIQMRGMGRIACQALVPCADDVWDAKDAIEWANLVLEHKATRESHDRPLCSGKRQLGPILDALLDVDAPSAATEKSQQSSEHGAQRDKDKAKNELQRGLCFTVKEHFVLYSLLEGLHLLWIARHTPPFRTGTSYAADFSPTQSSFGAGLESVFCLKGGTAYHKINVLHEEKMLAALSRWMRLYHESFMPNVMTSSTGLGRPEANGKSATPPGSTRAPNLGPSNDRFQLHFRYHVIQLSVLFDAHHVVHALVATCGDKSESASSSTFNAAKGATNNSNTTAPTGVQAHVPLCCQSCLDPDSCPYRNTRLQRWAAVHAGAVIGNFMSMPRLSTLNPTILEGLGQAFGILVLLCRLQRSPAQRRRTCCKCTAEVREAPIELISDQCLHLDAERRSPGDKVEEMAQIKFDSSNDCWLQHGTLEEGAMLLGQSIQDWPLVLQDMGNGLKGAAGTWQVVEEFLAVAQKMLNSYTFYVD
ncbi:Putative Cys(2)His(2) zinc finger protein [Ustilago bromivora]|uniref:Cys(2)His(2) zinc finger protein n=1 Tax=Ustilago bromivora TaxID=307758 RepID=A0A1K0G6K8_9BASI|nr:Putative Cys(2)His(2) zinc finger protein [Ustilago bromivora]SYW75548.1 Putative Cys(2)His(2) zinc finger protein [Ustilago bromivora]